MKLWDVLTFRCKGTPLCCWEEAGEKQGFRRFSVEMFPSHQIHSFTFELILPLIRWSDLKTTCFWKPSTESIQCNSFISHQETFLTLNFVPGNGLDTEIQCRFKRKLRGMRGACLCFPFAPSIFFYSVISSFKKITLKLSRSSSRSVSKGRAFSDLKSSPLMRQTGGVLHHLINKRISVFLQMFALLCFYRKPEGFFYFIIPSEGEPELNKWRSEVLLLISAIVLRSA